MNDANELVLPELRPDIQISLSAHGHEGQAGWVIHDPLQHRYFYINRETKDLLLLWQEGLTPNELAERANAQLGLQLEAKQVSDLLAFLNTNQLLNESGGANWRKIAEDASNRQQHLGKRILRNYVFFKLPLFRPQQFLKSMAPYVDFLFSRQFFLATLFAGLLGLYFVSRDWNTLTGDLQRFFSIEGIAYFGIAIISVKVFHELGHAFTAVRFGCQVPTMGVAFFLLTPLLYTDVSDAWRLSSRRKRLLISAAGIISELVIASFATLLWAFLAPGFARDIVLILATTSWVMSLAINLNPLIKFDGYYLLSDIARIDNLQQRSFAFGKWKLRKILVAPDINAPEIVSPKVQIALTMFAWMTWVYRLVLFTTIALLVYHFSFKLLGIFLLALEIWLLVLRPVFMEFSQWRKLAELSGSPARILATTSIVVLPLLVLIIPWSSRINVPAVLQASELAQVYTGKAAQVVEVHVKRGSQVKQGAPIITLHSPKLTEKIQIARLEISQLELHIANASLVQIGIEDMLVLRRAIQSEQSKLDGLLSEKAELVVLAPIQGIVQELNPHIHPERWVGKEEQVALIANRNSHVIKGYIGETRLRRLTKNTDGVFIPDDLTFPSIPVVLNTVAQSGTASIEIAILASLHGGSIQVERGANNQLVPKQAQYLIEMKTARIINPPDQVVRGLVELDGIAESFAMSAFRQVAKILIRETGF